MKDLIAELLGTGLGGMMIVLMIIMALVALGGLFLVIMMVRAFIGWRRRRRLGQYEDVIREGAVADPFLGWVRSQNIEIGSLSPRSLADLQDRYNREVIGR